MSCGVILLVEDNSSDFGLAQRALAKAQIPNEVVVASDGQEALDYLLGTGAYADRDVSDVPVLAFLDLKLPKVLGLEVLRRIRATTCTRRLPVVILTSSNQEGDLAMAYDLGANSYVRKPIDFKTFAQTIIDLGNYWLGMNARPPKVC